MGAEETIARQVGELVERQQHEWPMVRDNYAALDHLRIREIYLGESLILFQHNPERRRSSAAHLDVASLMARPCFLCREHQPAEQEMVEWGEGRYKIQVNPYPIFPKHLTISATEHTPQSIADPRRVTDMLRLAHDLLDCVVLYNGPKSGASAPDHMHFQAGAKGYMPLCAEVLMPSAWPEEYKLLSCDDGFLGLSQRFGRTLFYIRATEPVLAELYFARLQMAMLQAQGEAAEPMQNLLCWCEDEAYHLLVFPRKKHRPSCYGDSEDQYLLSPASVDMGGLWVVSEEKDFNRLNETMVQDIYQELCLDNSAIVKVIDHLLYNEE